MTGLKILDNYLYLFFYYYKHYATKSCFLILSITNGSISAFNFLLVIR